jgi:thiamine biosynthesis lipoprotein
MAVDAALERLQEAGITPALVNAGGDLSVNGQPAQTDSWSIAIPTREDSWSLPLHHGAIATSGIERRHWQQGNEIRHHILDPRTGFPVHNDLWSVTSIAPNCTQAEIAAKVAFILGPEQGKAFLQQHQLAGLFVSTNGHWETGGNWPNKLMQKIEQI